MAMLPWDISSPRHVQQALKDAHFAAATCSEFEHPMHVSISDMVKLVVGPGSQLASMLDDMKASGRGNIHQEAEKVLNMLAGADDVTLFHARICFWLVFGVHAAKASETVGLPSSQQCLGNHMQQCSCVVNADQCRHPVLGLNEASVCRQCKKPAH